MPPPLTVLFAAGHSGLWHINRIDQVVGDTLAAAERMAVGEGPDALVPAGSIWVLRGTTSNTRYATRAETDALFLQQEGLLRPQATCAALIAIRKKPVWWEMAQDERRTIFEQSKHVAIGMNALPGVARRLHHSRDKNEPFDFVTWFEYAPEHEEVFEEMVARLRDMLEWRYVEREVDIRMRQDKSNPPDSPP